MASWQVFTALSISKNWNLPERNNLLASIMPNAIFISVILVIVILLNLPMLNGIIFP
jgi:hypothetical protein